MRVKSVGFYSFKDYWREQMLESAFANPLQTRDVYPESRVCLLIAGQTDFSLRSS